MKKTLFRFVIYNTLIGSSPIQVGNPGHCHNTLYSHVYVYGRYVRHYIGSQPWTPPPYTLLPCPTMSLKSSWQVCSSFRLQALGFRLQAFLELKKNQVLARSISITCVSSTSFPFFSFFFPPCFFLKEKEDVRELYPSSLPFLSRPLPTSPPHAVTCNSTQRKRMRERESARARERERE